LNKSGCEQEGRTANSVFAQLRAEGSDFGILSLIIFSYGLTSSKPPAILATLPGAGCVCVQIQIIQYF